MVPNIVAALPQMSWPRGLYGIKSIPEGAAILFNMGALAPPSMFVGAAILWSGRMVISYPVSAQGSVLFAGLDRIPRGVPVGAVTPR